jgi:hypothetical protein
VSEEEEEEEEDRSLGRTSGETSGEKKAVVEGRGRKTVDSLKGANFLPLPP